jgi:transcription initiation factor TFIIE subunit alpha
MLKCITDILLVIFVSAEIETMDSDDDDDDLIPVVSVGDRSVPVTEVNDSLIAQMTPAEKEAYIQVYQEYYSHMYD